MTVNARTISAILHDERGFNLSKWLSKKRYYSISAKAYSKKYNRYARMQTSIIYRAEILLGEGNWKILIRHPTMSTGLFILKTLEFLVSKRTKRTNLSSRLFPGRHNKTVKTTWDPRVDCKPEVGPRIRFSQNFGKEYIVKAKRILDVGCFIGTYTSLIDKAGCFGIDLDINALKTAKKHCVNSNFIVASVLDLPFRDGIFDLISMWEVIEHVPAGTEKQTLTEVHRALATSGAMLLSTPNDSLVCKISDPAFFLRGHRHYRAKKLMTADR